MVNELRSIKGSLAPALLAVVLSLLMAWPAHAQRRSRLDRNYMKNSPAMLEAVGAMAAPAATCTVRILVDEEPAALGTIIREDGYLLTKASELAEGFQVELPGGRLVPGQIIGVLKEHDLAAVKVEATGLTPAQFSTAAVNAAGSGQWLYSPAVGKGVLAIGNLSVQGLRRIPSNGSLLGVSLGAVQAGIPVYRVDPGGAAERAGLQSGDLIVEINGVPAGRMNDFVRILRNGPLDATYTLTVSREGAVARVPITLIAGQAGVTLVTEAFGVLVDQVTPGSGAEAAGVREGDILIAIDEAPVRNREALMRMIREDYKPGDSIQVTLLRNGDEETLEARLGYHTGRSIRGEFQNQLGSQLSARAVDFPAVLQHDSILDANQMGGPLVDLKGQVLGINIARAGRVETYALPAQVIEAAIPELLSGKLPTATAPAVTEEGKPPVEAVLDGE